ncbi:MAG: type II toxin-antitoxin system RelE/ParE family toxin [Devosia sp.]|nr:type II toxin-antitoxin system RelE/ParE family toxin [Devosia sp.]
MKLRFADKARRDLVEIAEYVAMDSPKQADLLVARIEDCCHGLLDSPMRFPVVRKRAGVELRRVVLGNYSIFYMAAPDVVQIVRILHAARDLDSLFPLDDD